MISAFFRIMSFLVLACYSAQIIAQEIPSNFESVEKVVFYRNKKFKLKKSKKIISRLFSKDKFEGPDFKIVLGKSEEALSTDYPKEEVLLKAATVYYHLSQAKNYFLETIKSQHVSNLKQITVRLEITANFNQFGHYGHVNLPKEFNNAVSVPAGKGRARFNISPWDQEIWFRPKKKIRVPNPSWGGMQGIFKQYRSSMHRSNFQAFIVGLVSVASSGLGNYTAAFEGPARSTAIIEGAYQSLGLLARIFNKTTYFLDTAVLPEVIYHEFSHIALSDSIPLNFSGPVNEGLADYFATKISGHPKLATKARKYSRAKGKNGEKLITYRPQFETKEFANIDFVLGLLYGIDQLEIFPKVDQFFYKMRDQFKPDSSISEDLVRSIIEECKNTCKNPVVKVHKLFNFFMARGL